MTIKIDDVCYTYQPDSPFSCAAVQHISTSAYPGETIGIAGHTGSGKSTLVQLIAGLLLPDSGLISVGDLRLYAQGKVRARDLAWRVSFVFQNANAQLFAETVEQEIAFAGKNLGWQPDLQKLRVGEALQAVGLTEDYLPRNPLLLSGGEKRRVALAGALVTKAPIIILDEPLVGLDRKGKEDFLGLLRSYQAQADKIILCVSHDMDFIAEYCDRLWLMAEGELIADGPVEQVFAQKELLSKARVDLPTSCQLVECLCRRGAQLDALPLTCEAAAACIADCLTGKQVVR